MPRVNPLKLAPYLDILGRMTFSNLAVGFAIGFPVMVALGPISVLLLDQGLDRGTRTAAPAAVGVAGADLSLSLLAATAGASAAARLAPVTSWLTVVAVAVLLWLAVGLARSGAADLRASASPATAASRSEHATVAVDLGPPPIRRGALHSFEGTRLAAAFYGLTIINPLTLVLFVSLVVAGGPAVGTIGWAVGMALASLTAHGGFVVLGSALGQRLPARGSAYLRIGAGVFMAGLAVSFALT